MELCWCFMSLSLVLDWHLSVILLLLKFLSLTVRYDLIVSSLALSAYEALFKFLAFLSTTNFKSLNPTSVVIRLFESCSSLFSILFNTVSPVSFTFKNNLHLRGFLFGMKWSKIIWYWRYKRTNVAGPTVEKYPTKRMERCRSRQDDIFDYNNRRSPIGLLETLLDARTLFLIYDGQSQYHFDSVFFSFRLYL